MSDPGEVLEGHVCSDQNCEALSLLYTRLPAALWRMWWINIRWYSGESVVDFALLRYRQY
jgi:hypothetical protein